MPHQHRSRFDTHHRRSLHIWLFGLACIALAAAVCGLTFMLEGHTGLSLWDEGYLWYGSQRVLAGDMPIRDFKAYDIGRYDWCASFMYLSGNTGIMIVRVAAMSFAAAGMAMATGLIVRANQRGRAWLWLIPATVVLALWLIPRHKLFDITASIALVTTMAMVIARPQVKRVFWCGIIVGLCAVIGRNHGFYGVVGFCLTIIYLAWRDGSFNWPRVVVAFIAGVVIGYLPILASLVLIPGFANAFFVSVLAIFHRGTNLPLPIPWPWLAPTSGQAPWHTLQQIALGCMFLALPLFDVFGLALLVRRTRNPFHPDSSPVFAAAVMMSIPYTHYAFSRADVSHLAQGLFPLLIGVFSIPVSRTGSPLYWIKASCCGLVISATLLVALPQHPGDQALTQNGWRNFEVNHDEILMSPDTARQLQDIQELVATYAPDHRVLAVPYWPGFYAWYGIRSPIWEIYALFPQSVPFQQAEITRLQVANPSLIMLLATPVDNNPKLRYSSTHALIYAYIRSHYREVLSPEKDLLVFINPGSGHVSTAVAR